MVTSPINFTKPDDTPPDKEPINNNQEILDILDGVKDPEIPVLSIRDLGILRTVDNINGVIIVTITPTYSGCPAIETICSDIEKILTEAGFPDVQIKVTLSPAWTTDWMTETGKKKLEEYGIAAPQNTKSTSQIIRCPKCKSEDTYLISEYGSTACKSMCRCLMCKETFCYFKAI